MLEIISFIAIVIGACLLISNNTWDINVDRLKKGVILANFGAVVLCAEAARGSEFGNLYIIPIVGTAIALIRELIMIREIED